MITQYAFREINLEFLRSKNLTFSKMRNNRNLNKIKHVEIVSECRGIMF